MKFYKLKNQRCRTAPRWSTPPLEAERSAGCGRGEAAKQVSAYRVRLLADSGGVSGERRLGSWQPRCLTSGRTRSFISPASRNAGPAPSDPTARARRRPRRAKHALPRRARFPARGGDPMRPRRGGLPFPSIRGVFNRGGPGPPSLPQGRSWPRNRPNLATLPLRGPECRALPDLAVSRPRRVLSDLGSAGGSAPRNSYGSRICYLYGKVKRNQIKLSNQFDNGESEKTSKAFINMASLELS